MAKNIHIARIGQKPITPAGTVLDKNEASIKEMMTATTEDRILTDPAIPNTAGFPRVKDYLELEASVDFVLCHLDQNMVITYEE